MTILKELERNTNMRKFKAFTAATIVALSTLSHAETPGGWLYDKWDPASTNSIQRLAMPTEVSSAGSVINGTTAPCAAKPLKAGATRTLLGASGSVSFSPSGLSGNLPVADDSRIQDLARGLDHNWERCFDFVRNHIFYTPYPGIMKGPERTLLDREGNAADQSFLLCALLRASGYSSATVLYAPLKVTSSFDSGFIFPLYNYDGNSPYNAVTWLAANSNYAISRKLGSNGLGLCWMGDDHLGIEHYWVRVEIDGESVDLDPSIKPQPTPSAKNAKTASGYDRDAFLAAAGGTVDANSAKNLSESGIANYLKGRVAELKAAWNIPGASPSTILGMPTITPRVSDEPRFHGVWSSRSEPIDLLAASSADILDSLRTKVKLDNYGYDFMTPANTPDYTAEFSFYLDEVGSRTLWFAKDENADLGFYVDEEKISQSALWDHFGAAAVGVNVACTNHPTYHSYMMFPEDGQVHVLSVNLGGDNPDGIRKVASKRISDLRKRGVADTDNIMRAALLQLQGQQWLAQVEKHSRVWSRVVGGDKSHYYNIGIAGQSKSPFVDMANSYGRGYGGSGLVESHMMFSSALEHSVIEQLNGITNLAVSTVKILSLANASGNPIYFADSNNVASVVSSLSGYSDNQKNTFKSSADTGEIYLLPKQATVKLNKWTGTGYISHGKTTDGGYHTGMIISGGMNGGYCTLVKDPEGNQYLLAYDSEGQSAYIAESTQADPVSMPSGAFLDDSVDLAVARAVPLAWTRSYDTRKAGTVGDLGRGWSHGFESSIIEASDADAALGSLSLDAMLPIVVASVAAEDMMSETEGLSAGEIARRWTAAALVANWWTEQLTQTYVMVNVGNRTLPFVRMPDGTFAGGPGVTATLTCSANGIYTLKERHGNTYVFNADKKLASITDPSSNTTTLVYSNGKLARVENSFGAKMTIARDFAGRIASVTDNSGKRVYYAYDANGCMTSVTDAAGEVWPYTYDSTSYRMLSKKNPNGDFLIRNTYNENGQVTNQISSNGQPWRFGYVANLEAWNEDPKGGRLTERFDSDGRVLSRTRRDGATSSAVYDGHGHVAVATDALGNKTSFAYDNRDNLLSTTEGSGALLRKTSLAYDSQDRLIAATNALGYVTLYTYDSCHRVIRKTAPDGTYTVNDWNANGTLAATHFHDVSGTELRRTTASYNSYGLPSSTTFTGKGLPAAGITTTTSYNTDGSVSSKVDALNNRTSFAYDAAGRLVSTTDAANNTSTITYDRAGNVIAVRDALGRETRTTYTASGKPLVTTNADGSITRIEYDVVEDVLAATDARGARSTVVRDAEGRPISATDALGNTSYTEYDILGRLVWRQDASGVESSTGYDVLSRPVVVQNALGAQWMTGYDKLDRAVSTTTPLGRTSRVGYDNVGQLVSTTRPSGAVDSFGYDAMGNQNAYTNSENHVYRTGYDSLGRVVASTNALDIQVASMTYDKNGNLTQAVDGNGVTRSFTYDALDRLVSRTSPDETATFTYNAVGSVLTCNNATASETFTYDSMDILVAARTVVNGLTVNNEWRRDNGGLVTNIVYAAGKAVKKEYDIEGRLVRVSDWLGHTWTFSWDGAGRLVRLVSPDGRVRTQTYDVAGRLASWQVGDILGRTLEYDLSGRKTCDNVTAGAMPVPSERRVDRNTFDAADRLVSSAVNLNGTIHTETFSYDRNDAMISATANGETVSFRYDANGALAGFSPNGAEQSFAYDALGNRVIANGHVWILDQNDALKRPLLEYDASGNFVRAYIWTGGMLLGYIDANNVLTVAHMDEMGGVAVLSQTDGTVTHTAFYGPHGEDWGRTGANPTPFAWLGGYGVQKVSSTTFIGDIYLTRHRLYAPAQQRFLSSDPIGLAGGMNLYVYGKGNPLAYIDPLGLCSDNAGGDFYNDVLLPLSDGFVDSWIDTGESIYSFATDKEVRKQTIQNLKSPQFYKNLYSEWDRFFNRGLDGDLSLYEVGHAWGNTSQLFVGGAATKTGVKATASASKTVAQTLKTTTYIEDVTIQTGKTFRKLNVDLRDTIKGIESQKIKPKPSKRSPEGVWSNDKNILPSKMDSEYYHEYLQKTPDLNHAGTQRIVQGKGGELYYTSDHYHTFTPLNFRARMDMFFSR